MEENKDIDAGGEEVPEPAKGKVFDYEKAQVLVAEVDDDA